MWAMYILSLYDRQITFTLKITPPAMVGEFLKIRGLKFTQTAMIDLNVAQVQQQRRTRWSKR